MKWQLLSLVSVVVVIWGCDALDEPTAGVQSASGVADANMTYRVGLTMAKDSKEVKLAIHRDSDGNPVCVVVGGFGSSVLKVPLQLGGTGEWKLNASDAKPAGTYSRYRPEKQSQHDIVLHWTKERSGSNLTEENRLEYFMVTWNNDTYEYQSDVDSKSNITHGLITNPQPALNNFGGTCS